VIRRSPRSFVALGAAVVIALATLWVVATDLRALHGRARDLGARAHVVVARHDLALGATVAESDVRRVSRHASTLPPGALDIDAVVGQRVVIPVVAGAVVQQAHVGETVVEPGYRAVRIRTEDGLVPARGAVVDVLAAFDPGVAPAPGAVTVAAGARVLGAEAPDDTHSETGAGGVTLLVTEDEAHALAYADAFGVLSLALAPPEAACC
jgi:Flp pilus assembly protein CpaB